MSTHVFQSFSENLDAVPVQAILSLMDCEGKTMAENLENRRTPSVEDASSILTFCTFLKAAAQGHSISSCVLPFGQVAFYRKTVTRLVEAGTLPSGSLEQFDEAFVQPLIFAV